MTPTCTSNREKFQTITYTIFRVTIGVIMAVHGWDKLMNLPNVIGMFTKMGFPAPEISAYLAVAGELGGGLGLIVGALTPIAAFGIFCTMAVAVFKVHFANGLLAKDGGFEYPLTLMVSSLYIIAKGGGCLSIDSLLCKWKETRKGNACCGG